MKAIDFNGCNTGSLSFKILKHHSSKSQGGLNPDDV